MAIKNHYFVYDKSQMKLYANALTGDEAVKKYDELRCELICKGKYPSFAAIESLTNKDNRELCEALGNAIDFYVVQRMIEDGFKFEEKVRLLDAITQDAVKIGMRAILHALVGEHGEKRGKEIFEWYCATYHVGIADEAPASVSREVLGI